MTSTPPIRLVLGEEDLLVARAIAEISGAVRAADPDTDVREWDAGSATVGEFVSGVSPALFGGGTVVVLRNAQNAKKDLSAAVLKYAAGPVDGVYLVVAHAGEVKGKAFADALRKAGADVVSAAKLKRPADRAAFVREEFRRLGARCGADAADALLTAIGNDLRELAAACHQLVADTGGSISVDVINRYYRGRAEVTGFAVADAAVVGDVPGALEALRWAMSVGMDAVPIADALATGVRNVARVAGAGRGSAFQLASTLGMPAWRVERAQAQTRGWTPEGLALAMDAAAEVNAAVKGGSDDRGYALERAIFAIAAARKGDARAGGAR
ncbi:MAG TPA: DNA polymerase III subunit delta [Phytomonospora sp.]